MAIVHIYVAIASLTFAGIYLDTRIRTLEALIAQQAGNIANNMKEQFEESYHRDLQRNRFATKQQVNTLRTSLTRKISSVQSSANNQLETVRKLIGEVHKSLGRANDRIDEFTARYPASAQTAPPMASFSKAATSTFETAIHEVPIQPMAKAILLLATMKTTMVAPTAVGGPARIT